ncbi:calcium-binding protein [Pseudodonghicola flavimaris]|uniref:Hemolysin type calcium-binding protein n=1 Tax=Pseudodonghicola flavimaris TaxID=3050036 RepID=A0ABT7EVZ5_9RHOB|nr:hypothetical protein [Pseudodonghicola flavimaris]MDK3016519.1 hypothetical protein [Pseudodonghicola flavimaris]
MKVILKNGIGDRLDIAPDLFGFGVDTPDGLDAARVGRKDVGDGVYRYAFKIDGDDTVATALVFADTPRNKAEFEAGDWGVWLKSIVFKDDAGKQLASMTDIDWGIAPFKFKTVSTYIEQTAETWTPWLAGDDKLSGNRHDNLINAGDGDDTLNGGGGRDTLIGGAGNDILDGGRGRDTLTGSDGADAFIFSKGYGKDTITDFELGVDTLILDHHLWKGDLTERQIVNKFASFDGDGILFDFGRHELKLEGIFNAKTIIDDIQIA